jgi:hypothetical protein
VANGPFLLHVLLLPFFKTKQGKNGKKVEKIKTRRRISNNECDGITFDQKQRSHSLYVLNQDKSPLEQN